MFLFYTKEESVAKQQQPPIDPGEVMAVFDCWRDYHPRQLPKAHAGLKEWQLVVKRFRDGYTVQDLKDAIAGIHVSPWHCGENPNGKKYQSLELCLRDAKHVDQFIDALEAHGALVLSEKTQKSARVLQNWMERMGQQGDQLPRIEGTHDQ